MDESQFWQMIDESRRAALGDVTEQGQQIKNRLCELAPGDIIDFKAVMNSKLNKLYTHDLWAVPYIAYNGCSDDGFENFRAWLISFGRDTFEKITKDPGAAIDLLISILPSDSPTAEDGEAILLVANDAYLQKTGKSIWDDLSPQCCVSPQSPSGVAWKEGDLAKRYPKLWKVLNQNGR